MTEYTFNKINPYSPVDTQKFMWLAEYFDNTGLPEIDCDTKKENRFSEIDKRKLAHFGIVGNNNKLKFAASNGMFSFNGKLYSIAFKDKESGIEYVLSGNSICDASDIISYKKAHADMVVKGRNARKVYTANTIIDAFYFGYKNQMTFADGFNIFFKPIVCIPINGCPYIEINITGGDNKAGDLIVRKNGKIVDSIKTSIIKDIAMKLNWKIR